MAARSSTSSSDGVLPNEDDRPLAVVRARGSGTPWALLGAIALLVGVDLALHRTGWPQRVPYDNGRMEYYVAAALLNRNGPAEVSVVGSSRTRESLLLPKLVEQLSSAAGRPVAVSNYAASGAHTSDFEAMARRILRDERKPRLILCGISERDLIVDADPWDEVPTFWNFDDWRESFGQRGSKVRDDLPVVIRNAMGQWWRTLGERNLIRFRLVQLARRQWEPDPLSPMEGGLTVWQRSSPARTLVKNPVRKSRIVERAGSLRTNRYPDPQLRQSLRDMAAACQRAGVPLVFYELHMSQALRSALPKGLYRKFLAEVGMAAREHNARFVRLADLKLELDDNDMREPSHMSVRGSEKLTAALAEFVIGPTLGIDVKPPPQPPKRRKRRPASTPATTSATA